MLSISKFENIMKRNNICDVLNFIKQIFTYTHNNQYSRDRFMIKNKFQNAEKI